MFEIGQWLNPTASVFNKPPQKVAGIRSIKAAFKNLFTEVDSIVEMTLSLKGLSLPQHVRDLASCYSFTRIWSHPSTSHACSGKSRPGISHSPEVARPPHITHVASITSACIA